MGFSDLAFSAAAFVVLNRWVRRESAGHFRGSFVAVLAGLGVMSYSLYLIHEPLVRLLVNEIPSGTSLESWLLRLVVIVPACLGVAALFFLLIERRFLVGSAGVSPRASQAAAPAGPSAPSVIVLPWRLPGHPPTRPRCSRLHQLPHPAFFALSWEDRR
jgi:peptidoglycan/LPS O-acetylase OafA/YrhL